MLFKVKKNLPRVALTNHNSQVRARKNDFVFMNDTQRHLLILIDIKKT